MFSESTTRWPSDRVTRVISHAHERYHGKGFEQITNTHICALWGFRTMSNVWWNDIILVLVINVSDSTAYGFVRRLILPEW